MEEFKAIELNPIQTPHTIQFCTGKCYSSSDHSIKKCVLFDKNLASFLVIKEDGIVPAKSLNLLTKNLINIIAFFASSTHPYHKHLSNLLKKETRDLCKLTVALNDYRKSKIPQTLKNFYSPDTNKTGIQTKSAKIEGVNVSHSHNVIFQLMKEICQSNNCDCIKTNNYCSTKYEHDQSSSSIEQASVEEQTFGISLNKLTSVWQENPQNSHQEVIQKESNFICTENVMFESGNNHNISVISSVTREADKNLKHSHLGNFEGKEYSSVVKRLSFSDAEACSSPENMHHILQALPGTSSEETNKYYNTSTFVLKDDQQSCMINKQNLNFTGYHCQEENFHPKDVILENMDILPGAGNAGNISNINCTANFDVGLENNITKNREEMIKESWIYSKKPLSSGNAINLNYINENSEIYNIHGKMYTSIVLNEPQIGSLCKESEFPANGSTTMAIKPKPAVTISRTEIPQQVLTNSCGPGLDYNEQLYDKDYISGGCNSSHLNLNEDHQDNHINEIFKEDFANIPVVTKNVFMDTQNLSNPSYQKAQKLDGNYVRSLNENQRFPSQYNILELSEQNSSSALKENTSLLEGNKSPDMGMSASSKNMDVVSFEENSAPVPQTMSIIKEKIIAEKNSVFNEKSKNISNETAQTLLPPIDKNTISKAKDVNVELFPNLYFSSKGKSSSDEKPNKQFGERKVISCNLNGFKDKELVGRLEKGDLKTNHSSSNEDGNHLSHLSLDMQDFETSRNKKQTNTSSQLVEPQISLHPQPTKKTFCPPQVIHSPKKLQLFSESKRKEENQNLSGSIAVQQLNEPSFTESIVSNEIKPMDQFNEKDPGSYGSVEEGTCRTDTDETTTDFDKSSPFKIIPPPTYKSVIPFVSPHIKNTDSLYQPSKPNLSGNSPPIRHTHLSPKSYSYFDQNNEKSIESDKQVSSKYNDDKLPKSLKRYLTPITEYDLPQPIVKVRPLDFAHYKKRKKDWLKGEKELRNVTVYISQESLSAFNIPNFQSLPLNVSVDKILDNDQQMQSSYFFEKPRKNLNSGCFIHQNSDNKLHSFNSSYEKKQDTIILCSCNSTTLPTNIDAQVVSLRTDDISQCCASMNSYPNSENQNQQSEQPKEIVENNEVFTGYEKVTAGIYAGPSNVSSTPKIMHERKINSKASKMNSSRELFPSLKSEWLNFIQKEKDKTRKVKNQKGKVIHKVQISEAVDLIKKQIKSRVSKQSNDTVNQTIPVQNSQHVLVSNQKKKNAEQGYQGKKKKNELLKVITAQESKIAFMETKENECSDVKLSSVEIPIEKCHGCINSPTTENSSVNTMPNPKDNDETKLQPVIIRRFPSPKSPNEYVYEISSPLTESSFSSSSEVGIFDTTSKNAIRNNTPSFKMSGSNGNNVNKVETSVDTTSFDACISAQSGNPSFQKLQDDSISNLSIMNKTKQERPLEWKTEDIPLDSSQDEVDVLSIYDSDMRDDLRELISSDNEENAISQLSPKVARSSQLKDTMYETPSDVDSTNLLPIGEEIEYENQKRRRDKSPMKMRKKRKNAKRKVNKNKINEDHSRKFLCNENTNKNIGHSFTDQVDSNSPTHCPSSNDDLVYKTEYYHDEVQQQQLQPLPGGTVCSPQLVPEDNQTKDCIADAPPISATDGVQPPPLPQNQPVVNRNYDSGMDDETRSSNCKETTANVCPVENAKINFIEMEGAMQNPKYLNNLPYGSPQDLSELNYVQNSVFSRSPPRKFPCPLLPKGFCFKHFFEKKCFQTRCSYSHFMDENLLITFLGNLIPYYLERGLHLMADEIFTFHSKGQKGREFSFAVAVLRPLVEFLLKEDEMTVEIPESLKYPLVAAKVDVLCGWGQGKEAFRLFFRSTISDHDAKKYIIFALIRFCEIHSDGSNLSPYARISQWGYLDGLSEHQFKLFEVELNTHWLLFYVHSNSYVMVKKCYHSLVASDIQPDFFVTLSLIYINYLQKNEHHTQVFEILFYIKRMTLKDGKLFVAMATSLKQITDKTMAHHFFETLFKLGLRLSKSESSSLIDITMQYDPALAIATVQYSLEVCDCEPSAKQLSTIVGRLKNVNGEIEWVLLRALLESLSYSCLQSIVPALQRLLVGTIWTSDVEILLKECTLMGSDLGLARCPQNNAIIVAMATEGQRGYSTATRPPLLNSSREKPMQGRCHVLPRRDLGVTSALDNYHPEFYSTHPSQYLKPSRSPLLHQRAPKNTSSSPLTRLSFHRDDISSMERSPNFAKNYHAPSISGFSSDSTDPFSPTLNKDEQAPKLYSGRDAFAVRRVHKRPYCNFGPFVPQYPSQECYFEPHQTPAFIYHKPRGHWMHRPYRARRARTAWRNGFRGGNWFWKNGRFY